MRLAACAVFVAACHGATSAPPSASSAAPLTSASSAPIPSSAPNASAITPDAAAPHVFHEASCTGPDLDLDRVLVNPDCDLPGDDARWKRITQDSAGGVSGGKLVYAFSPKEIHAKGDAPVAAQITITNVGATPAEIGVVVSNEWSFHVTATSSTPENGGRLVNAPHVPLAPSDARRAYVRIPPGGVARVAYSGKATSTRIEHLQAAGSSPAPWIVRPYPLPAGTYALTLQAPWEKDEVDAKAKLVVELSGDVRASADL